MALPININDLILGRAVESERVEYKRGWNPGSIYRSICAFANDFSDIGGGYVIVGVDEENGLPVLPPAGLKENDIDGILKEMISLNNLINPSYHPKISIEEIEGEKVLVIWVYAGDNRPYEVPDEIKSKDKKYSYYIRYGSSSIKANKNQREELITLSGKIPFDDRPNSQVNYEEVSLILIKDYLKKVESKLLDSVETLDTEQILSQMQLLYGPPEMLHPRNVALMMFSENPEVYFPYSHVEIVHFPNGESDPSFFEVPAINGTVDQMIKQTLEYLKVNVLKQRTTKIKGQAESDRVWNYPYEALEEVIANALYHRDYQTREPVEIRIYPERLMVINYGGPDRSIKLSEFKKGTVFPRRYRNRRLGDFLKELDLTEGKATGIPAIRKAMELNGSPPPEYYTDDERSFFHVILPVHPVFLESTRVRRKAKSGSEKSSDLVLMSSEKIIEEFGGNSYKILLSIQQDFTVSASDIARKIHLSSRGVEKNIAKLKAAGVLGRIGPDKGGEWKLLIRIKND